MPSGQVGKGGWALSTRTTETGRFRHVFMQHRSLGTKSTTSRSPKPSMQSIFPGSWTILPQWQRVSNHHSSQSRMNGLSGGMGLTWLGVGSGMAGP
ncbi:hypothetical protein HMPREF9946_03168 [Acetobacteraceae bacterium AT-5844]|nr:hypothetical protein HMPREF9946_03168 [Acetobacteraceae bacterium AT-5844]